MTNDTKADLAAGTKKSHVSVHAELHRAGAVSPDALLTTPMILVREKSGRKRSRKRYTRGAKGFQQLALGISKAAFRVTNSVAKGLGTFARESNKSGRKRRDGIIRDSLRNASSGVSDGLTELGRAPGEVARRINSGRVWRTVRVFTPFGN